MTLDSRISNPYVPQRPFATNAFQGSQSRQTSINETSRFSFASFVPSGKEDGGDESSSFDFPPTFQFDDFHNTLDSDEPDLSSFPAPGGGEIIPSRKLGDYILAEHRSGFKSALKQKESSSSELSFNDSLSPGQNSGASEGLKQNGGVVSMGPPIAPSAAKARRKSHFPVSNLTNETVGRAPRKSVGPGTVVLEFHQQTSPRRRPSLVQVRNSGAGSHLNASEQGQTREPYGIQTAVEVIRKAETSRDKKARSLQPALRPVQDRSSKYAGASDQKPLLKINTSRSPARSTGQRTNTPSSSKRLSIMPGSAHATGLGARTISPTDARRLKRMSMMPNPPPMPFTPPTPQSETPSLKVRSSTHSPSLIPRKSVTPSSSRTTPEASRKSYSSGISNSSTTSYSSFLAAMGPARISQSLSTSRLPTPKNRSDIVSGSGEDEVPPVPAIPKAFESPKAELEHSFFSVRKSSLPFDSRSLASASTADNVSMPAAETDAPKSDREFKPRRGHPVESGPGIERKQNRGTKNHRRTLQPLRLPPLNLLPLSTPTAARIAALYEGTNLRNITPPPKISASRAPSTPMTASRASFFSRSPHEEDPIPKPVQRPTSSSTHLIEPDRCSNRVPSSSSSTLPQVRDQYTSRASRKAMSPFVSSSLPKSSSDFGNLRTIGTEPNKNDSETKLSKLTGPRSQRQIKLPRDDASSLDNQSPVDRSTPSIGSSLRRKLSLTQRSISKTPSAAEVDTEVPPKPPKHDHMPPPRFPASATWSGPLLASPSPTQKTNRLNIPRKTSHSNVTIHHSSSGSSTWAADQSPRKESVHPDPTLTSASTKVNRPVLDSGSTSNSLSLKDFLRDVKTMDLQLDRDDLLAEDEMKKLASKRRDTETAAQEMDTLRRRATAKERVSPSQAIRMANLNIFERGEIVDYKDIYFCGKHDARKHVGDLSSDTANFGYDDERGDYNIVNGDHLLYRYEIIDILGKGSFGQVVRCIDHKTGGLVAIKIIRNKKRFHQQALVEVDILKKLREWVRPGRPPSNATSLLTFLLAFRILTTGTAWSVSPRVSTFEAIFAFPQSCSV